MSAQRLLFLVTDDRYFISHRLPMARAARAAGFEVHVAAQITQFGPKIQAEGFILHALPWNKLKRSPGRIALDILAIRRLYRAVRPQIIHHIALVPTIFGLMAATGLNSPTVNTVAGMGSGFIGRDWLGRVLRTGLIVTLRALLSRKTALTVVQNSDDRDVLIKIGVPHDQIRLVPGSGVDVSALTPVPEPEGPITVGIAARMLEDKGIRPLVKAIHLANRSGIAVRLLLAGDTDPSNRSAIPRSELERFATDPAVTWLGHVDDIGELWRQCHIAVLPSRREGMPKALLEAAAMGRPLIATDVPGCREITRDGETGLLVPPDDPAALAAAIIRLAANPDERKSFGEAGRRLVEKQFSADAIGRQTVALYRSLTQLPIDRSGFSVQTHPSPQTGDQ
jgi:glycosyltransferase involved in cell wall biosynthesis